MFSSSARADILMAATFWSLILNVPPKFERKKSCDPDFLNFFLFAQIIDKILCAWNEKLR